MLLSGEDGEMVTKIWLPCQPVAKPVLADFTGDGWNDVIITCAEGWVSACHISIALSPLIYMYHVFEEYKLFSRHARIFNYHFMVLE